MIDYVRFCGIIIIVSLVVGACKAMDNPTSLGVWLAKDTGNRPPVRNLMISHWNFHWVLAFAWILHGFPAMYEYVFDYWRVYQNDTSLHWFRLLPWKFVSTQRPAIWQQTVTCEFHPTKSTNNGESAITYIYIIITYIYIYYISCHLCFDQQTGGHFTKDKEMMLLCHALPTTWRARDNSAMFFCYVCIFAGQHSQDTAEHTWIPWFGEWFCQRLASLSRASRVPWHRMLLLGCNQYGVSRCEDSTIY